MKKVNVEVKGYVLKNSEGFYYCGCNTYLKKLHKARIYNMLRYANEAKDTVNNEKKGDLYYKDVKRDFDVVAITIKEEL